ncbi:MAG: pilin [Patescibacteria group bacterium]
MKNILTKSATILILLTLFLGTFWSFEYVSATGNSELKTYTLLSPLPCLNGTDSGAKCTNNQVENVDLGTYMKYLFNLAIAIASVMAVFMIVWGGFKYTATASFQEKSDGLKIFKNAIIGLVLILGSFLLLKTINPKLVEIDLGGLKPLTVEKFSWNKYYSEQLAQMGQMGKDAVALNQQRGAENTTKKNELSDLAFKRWEICQGANLNKDTDAGVNERCVSMGGPTKDELDAIDLQMAKLNNEIQDNNNKIDTTRIEVSSAWGLGQINQPEKNSGDIAGSLKTFANGYSTVVNSGTSDATTLQTLAIVADNTKLAMIEKYTKNLQEEIDQGTAWYQRNYNQQEIEGFKNLVTPYLPIDPTKKALAQAYINSIHGK